MHNRRELGRVRNGRSLAEIWMKEINHAWGESRGIVQLQVGESCAGAFEVRVLSNLWLI
jgi:hypothetical protein